MPLGELLGEVMWFWGGNQSLILWMENMENNPHGVESQTAP